MSPTIYLTCLYYNNILIKSQDKFKLIYYNVVILDTCIRCYLIICKGAAACEALNNHQTTMKQPQTTIKQPFFDVKQPKEAICQ